MADISTAQAMVTYYNERPPSIRGHNAYVQFSNHEQLKTENNPQVWLVVVYLCDWTGIFTEQASALYNNDVNINHVNIL